MRLDRSVAIAAALLLACAPWVPGCYRSAPPTTEPGAASPPAKIATGAEGRTGAHEPPPEGGAATETGPAGDSTSPAGSFAVDGDHGAGASPVPAEGASSPDRAVQTPAESAGTPEVAKSPDRENTAAAEAVPHPAETPAVPVPEESLLPGNAPSWARDQEELVYRVEFLGLTMGYARFSVRGMVRIGDRQAYHLTVRAWTSDLLSVFYPMNDTIDYYLDVETLAPIRQEFTNSRKEDDIAYYDQETGSIVYRYKKSGKIRKTVEAVPGVYDPVSVAYYFRTRELVHEEPARPMYAGRKLWEVSAKPLGVETIRTDRGRFDTVMIEPVLRRNGNLEHKGNLRVWMTRDERHVPVRLYAKFKKVRTWTLVGELVPDRSGG